MHSGDIRQGCKWCCQVLFAGNAARTFPQGGIRPKHLPRLHQANSNKNWLDTSVGWTLPSIMHPSLPWLCILDAALVHAGAEFRTELRKAVPHIRLVFVSVGYTSGCLPLDVADL
eukprot:5992910-Amphidinium_carterae.4